MAVEPQVFDVLVMLIRERPRVVSKEELLTEIWGTRFVSESALTSRIKALRRAFGDDGRSQRDRTAHGRGFRFVADVPAGATRPPSVEQPQTPATALRPSRAGCSLRRGPSDKRPVLHRDRRNPAGLCVARRARPAAGQSGQLVDPLGYDLETPVWRHWHGRPVRAAPAAPL